MISTIQEIEATKREKYLMTEHVVNEASENSIRAHEHARTTTGDKLEAERVAKRQYDYLEGVVKTARRSCIVYDDKLEYLYQKLKYEETGDEQYGEIVRMKEACSAFTTKYSPTIQEILHHAHLHKNLVSFYVESPLFWFDYNSIAICRNAIFMHYNKLMLLFLFDSPDIDQFLCQMYRIALRIRRQHTNPSATEFIRKCREKYVIPLTVRRVERCSQILKSTTPLIDDTICEIVSFVQSDIDRRDADTIIYRAT
jgi:hypothetical protein